MSIKDIWKLEPVRKETPDQSIRSMLDAPMRKVREELGLAPLEKINETTDEFGPQTDIVPPEFDTVMGI